MTKKITMLPAVKKSNALSTYKQDYYLEQKAALLQAAEVQIKLSDNDLMIAQAGIETPIRKIADQELVKKVATATKFICRDIGVKDWNNAEVMKYDATRFFDTLKKYYKDFSFKEVKLAFELAAVGELDEWLPRDKNGNPDKNHYQAFSLEYYTKILNAYRAKKNKVWFKARKALPAPVNVITEEQKAANKKAFIEDIYKAFYNYRDNGVEPRFILSIFINEFIQQGALEKKPEPSKSAIDRAYRTFIVSDAPRIQKKGVIANYHKNKIDTILLSQAESIENNKAIKDYFDKLIAEKTDIKTVITIKNRE